MEGKKEERRAWLSYKHQTGHRSNAGGGSYVKWMSIIIVRRNRKEDMDME